jgi:hypothetical protein
MFDWIVEAVNRGLYIHDPDALVIGVLDIYGFEIFEVPSTLPRLCVIQRGAGAEKSLSAPGVALAVVDIRVEEQLRAVLHQLRERKAPTDLYRVYAQGLSLSLSPL